MHAAEVLRTVIAPPVWRGLRTAVGPASMVGQLAVRSTRTQSPSSEAGGVTRGVCTAHGTKGLRALVVLLLLACTAGSVRPYVVIDSGVSTGKRFASPYFDVITQAEQFTRLFRELHAHQLPSPTPPAVDFAASLVLIAARGEKPTTGYGIDVERLARRGDVLQVHLRLRDPSPTASHATVLTQPFVMVQVQKEPGVKQVEFLDQDAALLASLPIPGLAQK